MASPPGARLTYQAILELLDESRAPEDQAELSAFTAFVDGDDLSAGLGDKGLRCGRVPRIQVHVDHRVDAAGEDLGVTEAIGVAAEDREFRSEGVEAFTPSEEIEAEPIAMCDQ